MKKFIKNLLDKLIKWLTQLKTKLEAKIITPLETDIKNFEKQVIADTQIGEQFICHYCHKSFDLLAKNIFPVSVPMLYKESYVQGKGVLCPHCGKTCITG
jgi:hypothetical protein